MKAKDHDIIMHNKIFVWLALAVGVVLSVPLIAMQFTEEVQWTLADFIVAGILLFGTGFSYVHVARVVPRKYRTVVGIVFTVGLLWVWAELAVGVFTNIGS